MQAVDSNSTVVWTVQYTYDVDDQLISRTLTQGSNSTTEHFGWIDGQMVFRTDANGMILDHYAWGLGTDDLLADEQYNPSTGALDHVYFTLGDAQGTPRDIAEVVAGSTNIVNHRQFDSFGNLLAQSAPAIDELFGSQGTYRDPTTNLDYHRARWLDPVSGRWLNEDPLGFGAGDSNTSRDTNNDPINSVDPSSLDRTVLKDGKAYWQVQKTDWGGCWNEDVGEPIYLGIVDRGQIVMDGKYASS